MHAARRTSTRPRPTHNSNTRVGAMTIHYSDWMDRHPSGSRQDTHGTQGPVRGLAVGVSSHAHRAQHQLYLHNTVAEHDTTHRCQNGRPTQELAGDQPEGRHLRKAGSVQGARGDQASESGDLWRSRPDGKTQLINEGDIEQDEPRGGGRHRRFGSQHSGTFPRDDHQRRVAPDD